MSDYLGDYYSGCSVAGSFTTVDTCGVATSLLGGTPCLVVYRLDHGLATGFTCSTAGITLARNCAGLTGLNTFGVNTNIDPTFYTCGRDYILVLMGGIVDSLCVSSYSVASFSLANRAALLPQTFARRVTVTTGGAANINWAGVESCTTATTLSCTTVYTADHLVQRPVVDACSTVYSVTNVANDVNARLSPAVINCITSAAIYEPIAVPPWPMTMCSVLGWLGAVATNRIVQEAGQQGVCNRGNTATIGKSTTTDDGTSAVRGGFI